MTTVKDIISWKKAPALLSTYYHVFFMDIENNLISKSDGEERIKIDLADFDDEAKSYIILQFLKADKDDLGEELMDILNLSMRSIKLDESYLEYMLDDF